MLENTEDVAEFYKAALFYGCKDAMDFSQPLVEDIMENRQIEGAICFYEIAVLYEVSDLKNSCLTVSFMI